MGNVVRVRLKRYKKLEGSNFLFRMKGNGHSQAGKETDFVVKVKKRNRDHSGNETVTIAFINETGKESNEFILDVSWEEDETDDVATGGDFGTAEEVEIFSRSKSGFRQRVFNGILSKRN